MCFEKVCVALVFHLIQRDLIAQMLMALIDIHARNHSHYTGYAMDDKKPTVKQRETDFKGKIHTTATHKKQIM